MRRLAPLPLLLLLLAPEAAGAATVLDTRVTCAPVTVYAPAAGRLDVSVAGSGDWDVELRDAAGRVVAAGASPDGREVASGIVERAGALTLKACGGTGRADVVVTHAEVERGPALKLVNVATPTRADKDRLVALGLDMTEHGGPKSLGVVLHGDDDAAALRDAGFAFEAVEAAPADPAASAVGVLPSGRTSYRTLAGYESEMKALAAANPSFVRLFTLPYRTYEGREVLGLEIAADVAAQDGRPAFLNMGVHHAREWPAGELTMEWAYELINGYKAGAPRATAIVERSRNLVVPIVNPDGFNASRSVGPANGRDETIADTVYILTAPGEYRRKNCRLGDTQTALCPISLGLAENGVDPNRNYGQFWGGPGSDANPLTQTYRGPAPFSEPETRNIKALVSRHQVTTLITNHTTAGLVLRAPGLAAQGDPVDEHRGYKQLGDDMARHNGYFSQKSFELYDTTGTTEDWSYNATGGFGFTFELYCGAPNHETGDCDAPAFHPRFATMAKEWDGTSAQADHGGFDGQGNREAYYLAAESTLDEARHSVLEGSAPAGTTLRLTKAFTTAAFDPAITTDDKLETTLEVGTAGTFRWHVNPSTRPIVEKAGGTESYTLTCERDGAMLATREVVVARGAVLRVDPCPPGETAATPGEAVAPAPEPATAACAAPASGGAGSGPAGGGTAPAGSAPCAAPATGCTPAARGAAARPSGRGLELAAPATITRAPGGRVVARVQAGTWAGRVADGYYVVRSGSERIALRRHNGRFVRLADFERRPACDALTSFRLSGPVFDRRGLAISYRTARAAKVSVTVSRAGKVVKRFYASGSRGGTFRYRGAKRGEYRVKLSAGGVNATLVSRRL